MVRCLLKIKLGENDLSSKVSREKLPQLPCQNRNGFIAVQTKIRQRSSINTLDAHDNPNKVKLYLLLNLIFI
jgi:hypothetical protein